MANLAFAIPAAQRDAAMSAVTWLPAFYPHVAVNLSGDRIELSSERHSSDALSEIWSTAFANEVLLASAESRRATAQTALTQ